MIMKQRAMLDKWSASVDALENGLDVHVIHVT